MSIGRVPGDTGIQPSIVTAKGDLIVATASGSVTNQAVGSNNQVLMADSAQIDGVKWANEATATLTAKGDILTATAANTISRLAVGSNNQVLTADSTAATGLKWATPSSGSYTLISTTSITGGTVSVTNIPTTYTELIIVLSDFDAGADNSTVTFTLNNDSSGSYVFNRLVTATASSGNTTGASSVTINTNLDSSGGASNANVVLRLFRYATTDAFKSGHYYGIWPHNDGWWYPLEGSFGYKSTSAITRFDLTCNNSGFTAAGNIYVYGAN